MKRWEAWWNHAALTAVSLTGLLYGIFKYCVPGLDPDSRAGHPLQPLWLKSHLLVAPFAVFGVGLLLRRHALARIRSGEKNGRRTGTAMLWIFAPLALTGYLIQVLVEPGVMHAAATRMRRWACCSLLGYAVHPKRRTQADTGTDE
jgi:hypothetical protein